MVSLFGPTVFYLIFVVLMGISSFLVDGQLLRSESKSDSLLTPMAHPWARHMLSGCLSICTGGRKPTRTGERTHSGQGSPVRVEETPHSLFSTLRDCNFYVYFYCFKSNFSCYSKKGMKMKAVSHVHGRQQQSSSLCSSHVQDRLVEVVAMTVTAIAVTPTKTTIKIITYQC